MIVAVLVILIIGTIVSAIQLKYADYVYNHISIYSESSLFDELAFIFATTFSAIGIVMCPIMAAICVYLLVA